MNYYDHHIGDYDSATAHLSWVEDAAYRRLISLYYRTERPIPADINSACRLVRAQSRDQRAAVEDVLREFFELRDDGWHQQRCDDEITDYKASEPEREARKTNETLRLARHRAERAELFGRLNAAGQHAAWNASIAQLREMVKRLDEQTGNAPATPEISEPATPATAPETQPATGTATPATATQYPPPTYHLPDPVQSRESVARGSRLPKDWTLPDDWAGWAKQEKPGMSDDYLRKMAATFRDHWIAKPGKDAARLDWEATWRNWVRRDNGPLRVNGAASMTPYQQMQVEKHEDRKRFNQEIFGRKPDADSDAIDGTAERVD